MELIHLNDFISESSHTLKLAEDVCLSVLLFALRQGLEIQPRLALNLQEPS